MAWSVKACGSLDEEEYFAAATMSLIRYEDRSLPFGFVVKKKIVGAAVHLLESRSDIANTFRWRV